MGWASIYIDLLLKGQTVSFRPKGNSMQGKIESGQLCTVAPLQNLPIVGDIVLCRVKANEYLHIIKSIQDGKYQIGNNKGGINGWINIHNIFGQLIKVKP